MMDVSCQGRGNCGRYILLELYWFPDCGRMSRTTLARVATWTDAFTRKLMAMWLARDRSHYARAGFKWRTRCSSSFHLIPINTRQQFIYPFLLRVSCADSPWDLFNYPHRNSSNPSRRVQPIKDRSNKKQKRISNVHGQDSGIVFGIQLNVH